MKKISILIAPLLFWACLLPAVTAVIGDGNSYNDAYGYPAVYGGYFRNAREQYLIEATEFMYAGGGAGNITSLAFNVSSPNGCGALPNFTIRLGHTAAASLNNTFVTGLTQVYSIAAYQPVPGLNTHVFNTPFAWDGTSNVVVEVTFDFQVNYTSNASNYYTYTSATKTLYFHSDYTSWPSQPTGTLSRNRPNMHFAMEALGPIAPLPAFLVYPYDGMDYQPLDATLNWAPSIGDPQFYKVYFGTADPPPLVAVVGEGVTSYDPELAYDTTYYWRIVPFNAIGDATGCPLWSFSTRSEGTSVVGNGNNYTPRLPINSYYGYSYSQVIYLASELDGPGQIDTLAWYWNGAVAGNYSNDWTVYLGTTAKGSFSGSMEWEPLSNLTQVFHGNVALPAVPCWINVTLDTPYGYDGVNNLLIAVDENEPDFDYSEAGFFCTETPDSRALLYYSDGINPDPASPPGASSIPHYIANLAVVTSPLPNLAPLPPVPDYPADSQTGLPIEGFDLTWHADLNGGGLPDAYGVYINTSPDFSGVPLHYAVTPNPRYNPVTEGGMTFNFSETWYWSVKAIRNGWPDSPPAAPRSFVVIGSPPQISVDPGSFSLSLDHGYTAMSELAIENEGQLPLYYHAYFTDTTNRAANREQFDLQMSFTAATSEYELGVGFDGSFIYTCYYNNPGLMRKYFPDGTFVEDFTIPNTPGLVDLAFDGTCFWGSTFSGTICQLDFNNRTLVSSFTVPFQDTGIAYDIIRNSLWIACADPGNLIYEVALDGTIMTTLNSATANIIGLGYDNISESVPTLWAYSHGGTDYNLLQQIDMDTGAVLQDYDVTSAIVPGLENGAGGMEVVSGLVPGTASLLCISQDSPVFALELCRINQWTWPVPYSSSVDGGSIGAVEINFDTGELNPGTYTGYYTIEHNAPETPPLEIPVQLTVTGTWPAQLSLSPGSHDFGVVDQMNPKPYVFRIINSGGSLPAPLIIQAGGISLAYQAEANFSVQTPGLPVSLDHGEFFDFTVTFTPQSPGVKNGSLVIMDNLGRNFYTAYLSGTGIAEEIGNIVNFQASIQNNNDVLLTWILAPGNPADPAWLHYDSGTNFEGIGTGGEYTFEVAAKFPIATLAPYAGQQLSRISFYPRSALTAFTLKVYTGDEGILAPNTLLLSQPVVPSANAWNEVSLINPLWITGTQALWIGYEAAVPASSDNFYPAGCDAGPAVAGLGDLFYYNGIWQSIYNSFGLNYNWNIQAWIGGPPPISPPPEPLNFPVEYFPPDLSLFHNVMLAASGNSNPPSRVLRGFNVYRDGALLNPGLLPTPTYTDVNVPNRTYVYTVQAVYYSASSPMSNPNTVTIEYYPPLTLPFFESWDSGSLEAHHWSYWVDNWQLYWSYGYPDPCLFFTWTPEIHNYGEPITSHVIDGNGCSSVNLSFDLLLSNYDLNAENWLAIQVWNGFEWTELANWSSLINGVMGFNWTNFSYDISPWAAGNEFRIRFLAYGENSYSINYWGIDNLSITGVPLNLPVPVVTATYDPVAQLVYLDWEPVADAEWYGIYRGPDPLGPLYYDGAVSSLQTWYYLTPADREFFEVTAGTGLPPVRVERTRR